MNRLTRRKFISISSLGITFGISGISQKVKGKNMQSSENFNNDLSFKDSRPVKKRAILLHPDDNVAVALEDLHQGVEVPIGIRQFVLNGFVAAKHKFTLSDVATGETIYLYGIKVGTAIRPMQAGTAITVENTVNAISEVQKNSERNFKWTPPSVETFSKDT